MKFVFDSNLRLFRPASAGDDGQILFEFLNNMYVPASNQLLSINIESSRPTTPSNQTTNGTNQTGATSNQTAAASNQTAATSNQTAATSNQTAATSNQTAATSNQTTTNQATNETDQTTITDNQTTNRTNQAEIRDEQQDEDDDYESERGRYPDNTYIFESNIWKKYEKLRARNLKVLNDAKAKSSKRKKKKIDMEAKKENEIRYKYCRELNEKGYIPMEQVVELELEREIAEEENAREDGGPSEKSRLKNGEALKLVIQAKCIIDFRDVDLHFKELLDDILYDGKLSSFGKTRLFTHVYEFLRAQGISVYSSCNLGNIFSALTMVNKKLFTDEEGIYAVCESYKQYISNLARTCERSKTLYKARRNKRNLENELPDIDDLLDSND